MRFLWIFCEKEIAHAYECRKYLISKYNKKIAPKNVSKHVIRLLELGLIKRKTMEENTKHNAVYYTLSSFGIFYIINNSNLISHDLSALISIKSLFANHPYDAIFKFCLYPIINQQLIKKVDNEILTELEFYLRECSQSIKRRLESLLEIEKNGGYDYFVSSYPSILDSSLTEIEPGTLPDFIIYLKERFNINELDENKSKIEEIKKSEILKITSNEKVLFLKLDEKNNKAILYEQNTNSNEIIFNFDLAHYSDIYIITEFISQSVEQNIISSQAELERGFQGNPLSSLLLRLLRNNFYNYYSQSSKKKDFQSYVLLANNHKFMTLLKKIKDDFDSQYYLFKSMTSNISSYPTKNK